SSRASPPARRPSRRWQRSGASRMSGPKLSSRRSSSRSSTPSDEGAREDQPRARRRPAARGRHARGRDRSPADRPRRRHCSRGRGSGTALSELVLPQDYSVVLVLPRGAKKGSTKAVYDAFDGDEGFEDRLEALLAALEAGDLKALPPNDLASSPIADELRAAGAFRADVTGAGPAVYGLFTERDRAAVARELFTDRCETWLTAPAW